MTRPEAADVKLGDEVFVIQYNYGRGVLPAPRPARVVKAARVWLEIEDAAQRRHWRMRRDTQNEGTGYSYNARFVTPAQLKVELETRAATDFLREQGIEVRREGPWWPLERRMVLAKLLREAGES